MTYQPTDRRIVTAKLVLQMLGIATDREITENALALSSSKHREFFNYICNEEEHPMTCIEGTILNDDETSYLSGPQGLSDEQTILYSLTLDLTIITLPYGSTKKRSVRMFHQEENFLELVCDVLIVSKILDNDPERQRMVARWIVQKLVRLFTKLNMKESVSQESLETFEKLQRNWT